MAFTWQININKSGYGYTYNPSNLTGVSPGDQIFWTNNDDKPHWPAKATQQNYYMANQIAPGTTSSTFVPGAVGTLSYVDWLDQSGPTGTIVVSTPAPVT
jgi:plastocyanin